MKVATSVLASGLFGSAGDVVGAKWKGRQYVRTRVAPTNPNTASQQLIRNAFARMVACFQALAAGVKTFLDILGSERQMSGFNVYLGDGVKDERDNHFHAIMPDNRHCNPVAGFAAAQGAASGEIALTWNAGAWTNDDVPVVHYRKKEGAGDEYETPWVSFDVGATKMTAGALTVTGLTPGSVYAVALFPLDQSASAYGGGDVKSATAKP